MTDRPQHRSFSLARLLVWSASVGAPLVGAVVLAGWAWDLPAVKSIAPGLPKMAPNTALGLLLGGAALALLHPPSLSRPRRVAGLGAAWGLVLIGAATLFQYFSGRELGLHELLFRWADWSSRTPPSPPAPNTAFFFILLGAALLLLGRRVPASIWWADSLVLLALLGALLAFNGYLHGALALAGAPHFFPHTGMGLHTSLTLLLLGVGFLCTRPEQGLMGLLTRDTLGGFLARRLAPVGLLGPPGVGVVLELLHRAEFISGPARASLFSTVMSLGGVALVLLSSVALNRIDAERRRARAALQASEARARGLLESTPDPVVTVDQTGRIIFVNTQAVEVFGYRREELLDQPVEVLVPERWRQEHRRHSELYVMAPTVRRMGQGLPLRLRRKDGTELPVDISLSPWRSPEGLTITTIIRDVTEREEHLERLRAARAEAERERLLLQTVVDSAPVGILFVEPKTDEVRVNSALQDMLGMSLDPAAGRMQYLLRLRHPDGRSMHLEELPSSRALAGQEVPPEEYLICRANQQLPVLASAAAVRKPNGEVRGVVVCIQDISARRELERLREEYVGLISHDLRSPLQNISLRTQLLLRTLRQKGLAQEAATAEALLRNAWRMNEMVEELLEGSRLEAGQVELRRAPLDLVHFIEDVIDRHVPPELRSRLRLEAAAPLPEVPGDAPRLERVVVNLLTNALKYGAPGTPIVVRLCCEDEQARVSVGDEGPGLQPEELAHLFTKYYRTQEGRRARGVGLGLYITRLIVEAHGGRIHAESTPGHGSTFTFTLPLSADSPRQRQARQEGQAPCLEPS